LNLAWHMLSDDSQWFNILKQIYLKGGRPRARYLKSSIWPSIKAHICTIISNLIFIVGSGENINFWKDNWIREPLVDLLHIDPRYHDRFHGSVVSVIHNGSWDLPSALNAIHDVASQLVFVTFLLHLSLTLLFGCTLLMDYWLPSKHFYSWIQRLSPVVVFFNDQK